jgi:hypothetical protein
MANTENLQNILDEPVDLKGLLKKLDFTEEDLIRADLEQPRLYMEASRFRVRLMRKVIQAEAALELVSVGSALRIRKKYRELGKSITESAIKERVANNPDVQDCKKRLGEVEAMEEWAKLLLEAFKMRRDAVKILAEVLGAEANAEIRHQRKEFELEGYSKLKDRVRKKYAGSSEDE